MRGLELHHAVEIAEEVRTLDGGRVDAFVLQFMQKAAVSVIDEIADAAQVADVVVGGATVDVVNGHAGRDRFVAPGDIDGMGDKDVQMWSPRVSELLVLRFAMAVFSMLEFDPVWVYKHLSAIRIDADADDAAVSVVDIERDTCFRAGVLSVVGHELDTDVVEKKRFL